MVAALAEKTEGRTDLLAQLVQWFEDSEQSTQGERSRAERDRDYYDNKQLTDQEITELRKRGQPPIVINRIKRKINFLRGIETQQRVDPKALPRTPQHEDSAHAVSDALRFVADNNDLDRIRSKVWEYLLIEGMGGAEVTVEEVSSRPKMMTTTAMQRATSFEIRVRIAPWDRTFRDPHSSKPDFSDARYFGTVTWMDFQEAMEMYPDHKLAIENTFEGDSFGDTFDDRPRFKVWADKARKRVRIVQIRFQMGGQWWFATYTRGGILEQGPSPYLDEFGETEPDLILASAYIDRDNNRYGEVREMIDPQDEVNKRRSKALHILNTRQVIAEEGAVNDPRRARAELAKPDGWITKNRGFELEINTTNDLAQGQFLLLQQATNEMDLMGPNAAMQGKISSPADQSGRAIQAQQQGGFIELSPLLDNLRAWTVRIYRAIWNRVKQFWNEERWIRVTDDENNLRFVALNRTITAGEQQLQQFQDQGAQPQEIEAARQALSQDFRAFQPVGVENPIAEMDVDIIIDEAPDTVTIQHEQFQELVGLAQAGIAIPPDVLIEASQLRNKERLLELMKSGGADPEQAAQQAQIEQTGLQLEFAEKQADIEKTIAETEKLEVEAAAKAMETGVKVEKDEAATEKTMAETARTLTDILAPPEVARHI